MGKNRQWGSALSLYFWRGRHGILFTIGTGWGVTCPSNVCSDVIGRRRCLVGSQWEGSTVGREQAVTVARNGAAQVISCSRRCHWNASYRSHTHACAQLITIILGVIHKGRPQNISQNWPHPLSAFVCIGPTPPPANVRTWLSASIVSM